MFVRFTLPTIKPNILFNNFVRLALPDPDTPEYETLVEKSRQQLRDLSPFDKETQKRSINFIHDCLDQQDPENAIQGIMTSRQSGVPPSEEMYSPIIKYLVKADRFDDAGGLYVMMMQEEPVPVFPSEELKQFMEDNNVSPLRPDIF